MFYLGIDQHKRQLTVDLRGEDGAVILERQVRIGESITVVIRKGTVPHLFICRS
jgi:hypothetical protein